MIESTPRPFRSPIALAASVAVVLVITAPAAYASSPPTGTEDGSGALLPWRELSDIRWEYDPWAGEFSGDYVLVFGSRVEALDGTEITIRGYMMPIERQEAHRRFLLVAHPASGCSHCQRNGPENVIDVRVKRPVALSAEPITLRGTLELLRDDPAGIYYRLNDATLGGS